MSLAVGILILLLVGVLVMLVIQKYVPLDGQIKSILIAILWLAVVAAIVQRLGVLPVASF